VIKRCRRVFGRRGIDNPPQSRSHDLDFVFAAEVEKYRNHAGSAWIDLWDYWAPKDKYKILETEHIVDTTYRLYVFLVNFGMARGPFVRQILANDFMVIIQELANLINKYRLFDIELDSAKEVRANADVIDGFFDQVYRINLSHTHRRKALFYSKLLLPLWGNIVAFDQNFIKAYRQVFCESPAKLGWSAMLSSLLDRHENDLVDLPDHLKVTCSGHEIPALRLIDMAYWNYGRQL